MSSVFQDTNKIRFKLSSKITIPSEIRVKVAGVQNIDDQNLFTELENLYPFSIYEA